ncbi:MAG: OmpH family outer membrane protein [Planctomycetota bacterium]
MQRVTIGLLLLAVLLIAAQAHPGPRIGVVDLNRVFEGYGQKEAHEQELARFKADIDAKIQALDARLAELRTELELLQKGTSRYTEIEDQLLAVSQRKLLDQRRAAEEFQKRKVDMHEILLNEIGQAISALGRELGYTAVFQQEFTLPGESLSWRTVLYHDAEIDLTSKVLERLNQPASKGEK